MASHTPGNGNAAPARCRDGASETDRLGRAISLTDSTCGRATQENRRPIRRQHGQRNTPEWQAWQAAKKRCQNPNSNDYPNYGGRGIRVCARWKFGSGELSEFECFALDMGKRPSPLHTLDRRDNDGNYTPRNCRWATPAEQARNRRTTILNERAVIEIRRSDEPCPVLATKYGCGPGAIYNVRSRRSWREIQP